MGKFYNMFAMQLNELNYFKWKKWNINTLKELGEMVLVNIKESEKHLIL